MVPKPKRPRPAKSETTKRVIQRKISQLKASKTKNFKAGTLLNKIHEWRILTNDQWILDTVKGLVLNFGENLFKTYLQVLLILEKSKTKLLIKK